MPELPEVETVRRDIHDLIVGSEITGVVLGRLRTVRRYADPQEFVDELVGAVVTGTSRIGKYLFIELEGGDRLVVHLRMSGQLLWSASADEVVVKHTHVRLQFGSGGELRFVDPRTFGEMFVVHAGDRTLDHLGPDAWNAVTTAKELAVRLQNRRGALKTVLLDQTVVAGIGSIYADEICFRARVRPTRATDTLRRIDVTRLHDSMKQVLGEAISARGSTLGDGQYVRADGTAGTYTASHQVHARKDEACFACGGRITGGIVGQRSAYWCTRCQR